VLAQESFDFDSDTAAIGTLLAYEHATQPLMPYRGSGNMHISFRCLLTAACLWTVGLISPALLRGQEAAGVDGKCSCPCCTEKCSRCGCWFVVETDNFQACCQDSQSTAKLLVRTAESLRTKLQTKWLGDDSQKPWSPKCQIVLHPSLQSYVATCGRGSEHTVGSSLVKVNESRISSRQIDLVGDRTDFLSAALPHELTHVVLKDRFPLGGLSRWADEGIAIIADAEAKQGRHLRDLEEGIANHTVFDTASLVALDDYPGANRMGVFYGQSVSLVKFLVEEKDPQQFVKFIQRAGANGYDVALRECYGLQDMGQLDRQWRRNLTATATAKSGSISTILAAR
jgi:hypothetical protein